MLSITQKKYTDVCDIRYGFLFDGVTLTDESGR